MRRWITLIEAAEISDQSEQRELVFVYGSLKRSFSNDWHLETAQYLGTGLTPPRFDLLDLGPFPAIIRGKHRILGEIYEVDQETMKALDKLEGNGYMYQRKKVPVVMNGRQISVWIYIYLLHDGGERRIEPFRSNVVTWQQPARGRNPWDTPYDDDEDDVVADVGSDAWWNRPIGRA